jgi:hypothetical protein
MWSLMSTNLILSDINDDDFEIQEFSMDLIAMEILGNRMNIYSFYFFVVFYHF